MREKNKALARWRVVKRFFQGMVVMTIIAPSHMTIKTLKKLIIIKWSYKCLVKKK